MKTIDQMRQEARKEARRGLTKTDWIVILYTLAFTLPLITLLACNPQ